MSFWLSLLGYQAVWFIAVIGASHGVAWPAAASMLVYALLQLLIARNWRADLSLMAVALLMGFLLDGALVRGGLASYVAGWSDATLAPVWILALWMAFALTFTQSLRYLQTRLRLAALLGLLGGPLAYLGAARGWHVVTFADPAWRGLLVLGFGWAMATPALAWLARRGAKWSKPATRTTAEASA
jgi:hypothetical protein